MTLDQHHQPKYQVAYEDHKMTINEKKAPLIFFTDVKLVNIYKNSSYDFFSSYHELDQNQIKKNV